jgi:hypothetical protein
VKAQGRQVCLGRPVAVVAGPRATHQGRAAYDRTLSRPARPAGPFPHLRTLRCFGFGFSLQHYLALSARDLLEPPQGLDVTVEI